MKRISFIAIIASLLYSGSSHADVLTDLIGTWRVRTTYLLSGRNLSFDSQIVTQRLAGGGFVSVTRERVGGTWVVTTKEWALPDGTSLAVGYNAEGRTDVVGEGTWLLQRNALTTNYAFETLGGRINATAVIRQVNRNRFEQTVTRRGAFANSTAQNVFTRVR